MKQRQTITKNPAKQSSSVLRENNFGLPVCCTDELQAVKKSTSKNSRYNFCEVDFLHPGVLVLNKNGK